MLMHDIEDVSNSVLEQFLFQIISTKSSILMSGEDTIKYTLFVFTSEIKLDLTLK